MVERMTCRTTLTSLALQARDGNRAKVERLFGRLDQTFEAWAKMTLPPSVLRHVGPDDLRQAVCTRIWEIMARSYEPPQSFRRWAFSVAKRVSLELQRRARRCRLREAPMEADDLASIARWPGRDPRDGAATNEVVGRFLERVGELDPIDREIVRQCGLEAEDCPAVAERLGMTTSAVQKRWQRIRVRLRAAGFRNVLEPEWDTDCAGDLGTDDGDMRAA